MNRRDFFKILGGCAAAVALSPMLDLAEILTPPSETLFYGGEIVVQIKFMMNVVVHSPRTSKMLYGITQ